MTIRTMQNISAGATGALGAVLLVCSFAINPAPPNYYTIDQLREFAIRHHDALIFGGWLQAMGSLLLVLFLALVHLAGAWRTFLGSFTLLAGTTILMVSLLEVTFYIGAVQAAVAGDVTAGIASNAL